jgi:transposase
LPSDRGCDADWFRDALEAKGVQPCIPGRRSRDEPVIYDKRRYRRSSRIEIMFGRLKDWRRVAASPLATIDDHGLLLCRRLRSRRHLLAMTNES